MSNVIKGGETYSFEYNRDWLKKTGLMISLDSGTYAISREDSIRPERKSSDCLQILHLTGGDAYL